MSETGIDFSAEDTTAEATGTAEWFRINDPEGQPIMDGQISAPQAGGDMELDQTAITAGDEISAGDITINLTGAGG